MLEKELKPGYEYHASGCEHRAIGDNIKAHEILHYICSKILEDVSREIETFYESNHPGFILNLIANLLVKYFKSSISPKLVPPGNTSTLLPRPSDVIGKK